MAEGILHVSFLAHRDVLGTELDVERHLRDFARVCAECEHRLEGSVTGREMVGAMNEFFFGELGLSPDPGEDRVGHLFLDSLLETKRGPCLALSGLYLAVAERLDLPFFGVVVPGHFFVRYDDGRTRINVETLKKGASIPDDWYRKKYRVPAESTCYLRNLSREEIMAPHYFNLGNAYRASGRLDRAAEAYELATILLPGFAEAHGNLGVVHMKMGEIEKAIREFEAAIEANSLLAGAHLDLAIALDALGAPGLAGEHRARAKELARKGPGAAPATTGSE